MPAINVYQVQEDNWLTMPNLVIHKVQAITGETQWRLEGEHGFCVCPNFATYTAAGIDGLKLRDVTWGPNSIGYTPPDVVLSGYAYTQADLLMVRLPDRMFRQAIIDSCMPSSSVEYRFMPAQDDPLMVSLCEALDRAAKDVDLDRWPLISDSIGAALATRMVQNLGAQPKPAPKGAMGIKIGRVLDYIEANLHEPLRLEELAHVAAMSVFHFARAFRREMGVSPVRYVWLRRVERAKEALSNPAIPLSVVALDCGFTSQSHFSEMFKRETGVTPLQWRRSATL